MKKVFEMFTQKIDDWTFQCWTSSLRSEAGHPPFHGHEGDFSDFTYVDAFGKMGTILDEAGVDLNTAWSKATKFHLEVKSTLGPCSDPMFVSQSQLDKVCSYPTWVPIRLEARGKLWVALRQYTSILITSLILRADARV